MVKCNQLTSLPFKTLNNYEKTAYYYLLNVCIYQQEENNRFGKTIYIGTFQMCPVTATGGYEPQNYNN